MSAALAAGALALAAMVAALLIARARPLWRRMRKLDALARSSHELRGAITAISLGLSALERSASETAGIRDWTDALRGQVERASLAVEDLGAAGRSALVHARAPVEVDQLVRRRARAWARLASALGLEFQLQWRADRVVVDGDARRLAQALDNLISNALQHGGGRVRIVADRSGGRLRLLVFDGGPGLAERLKRPIAGRWHRQHGLGLVIARDAIAACGGNLTALQSAAGGAIQIELPVVGDSERPSADVVEARARLSRLSIPAQPGGPDAA